MNRGYIAKTFLPWGWLSDKNAVEAKVDHPKPINTRRKRTTNTATESVLTARRSLQATNASPRGVTQ